MFDQLWLDGVIVTSMGKQVLFRLDGQLPQSDFQENDTKGRRCRGSWENVFSGSYWPFG